MKKQEAWLILDIEPTKDIKQIKKAYSKMVKIYHPEDNPETYQKVREAYKKAMSYAKAKDVDMDSIIIQNEDMMNEPSNEEVQGVEKRSIFSQLDDIDPTLRLNRIVKAIIDSIERNNMSSINEILNSMEVQQLKNNDTFIILLEKALDERTNVLSFEVRKSLVNTFILEIGMELTDKLYATIQKGTLNFNNMNVDISTLKQYFLERYSQLCEANKEDTLAWQLFLQEYDWYQVLDLQQVSIHQDLYQQLISNEFYKEYMHGQKVHQLIIRSFHLEENSTQDASGLSMRLLNILNNTSNKTVMEGRAWRHQIFDNILLFIQASQSTKQARDLKVLLTNQKFIDICDDPEFLSRLISSSKKIYFNWRSMRLLNDFFHLKNVENVFIKDLYESFIEVPDYIKKSRRYIKIRCALVILFLLIYIPYKTEEKKDKEEIRKNIEIVREIENDKESQRQRDLLFTPKVGERDREIETALGLMSIDRPEDNQVILTTPSQKQYIANKVKAYVHGRLQILVRDEQYYLVDILEDVEYGPFKYASEFYEPNAEIAHYYFVSEKDGAYIYSDDYKKLSNEKYDENMEFRNYYLIYDKITQSFRFVEKDLSDSFNQYKSK